ncbi:MAG: type II toxin-antitoxin system RelE/ParE family toxin [Beijerinckiaceae bacterium]|nr:type II toxin-antitoxin system RelE/ParE family toxin [Beijerinckiaceae bacterium]
MTILLFQRPAFKRVYKKLHPNQRHAVHDAMRMLMNNPLLGEEKMGDLAGVRVHKFDCVNQVYLLAYLHDETSRTWLALGPHENFYRDLKR